MEGADGARLISGHGRLSDPTRLVSNGGLRRGDGRATVSRRVDVLEMERSHKRISQGAHRAGQTVRATFDLERSKDCTNAAVREMIAVICDRIGRVDTRLLRRILVNRMSFTECAALEGKGGDRGQNYVAHRFRDALEDLAEAWTAEMVALSARIAAMSGRGCPDDT